MTINGQKTTYCYDQADRLIRSSDQLLNSAKYDSHGNTTQLGNSAVHTTKFVYDNSDRNTAIESYNAAGNGDAIYYNRDVTGRIVARIQNTITGWKWALRKD
jgi:hypothetical protein